jgi:hypothetical protein
MKPCCETMATALATRDRRGLSVHLPGTDEATEAGGWHDVPHLVSRAVDRGHQGEVTTTTGVAVELVGRLAITFCPWCGRRLQSRRWPRR